ncbi:MAG: methyltransferase domain-containing protein [Antricoccus sp.]
MSDGPESMEAEFDTVAKWTANVAAELDPACRIPAGCRGSGGPGAMRWLLDHLGPEPGQVFLDCGGGMGGPAAFVAHEMGVRPLLTDPELDACAAARSLFGLAALRAGTRLPVATGAITVGWSLGVLSTVNDQPAFLAEIRRVLRPDARFGLLVYCAADSTNFSVKPPDGNNFPTARALADLLDQACLQVRHSAWIDDFAAFPPDWEKTVADVQSRLERRHGDDVRWQQAQEQSSRMGALLEADEVRGHLLVLQPI